MRTLAWTCLIVFGAGGGAVAGRLTRPATEAPSSRPRRVETALRALDAFALRGDLEPLRAAAQDLGDPSALPPEAADEIKLIRLVVTHGDAPAARSAALLAFARAGAPSPARARALLLVVEAGGADAAKAKEWLRDDYPQSWAAGSRDGAR